MIYMESIYMDYPIYKFVLLPFLSSFIVYWLGAGFWFLCDLYINPKYRIKGEIDWKLYKKSAIHTLLTQIIITPMVLYSMIPLWKWRGISNGNEEDNILSLVSLCKLIACPFLAEPIFFLTHRLGHTKYFYKYHKVHHQWNVPCAVSASYAHPVEFICCSLPTFLLPVFILRLNWYVAQLWFMGATLSVINSHSGYKYPNGSIRHTNHHKYNNRNYGPMKILDKLCGTEESRE